MLRARTRPSRGPIEPFGLVFPLGQTPIEEAVNLVLCRDVVVPLDGEALISGEQCVFGDDSMPHFLVGFYEVCTEVARVPATTDVFRFAVVECRTRYEVAGLPDLCVVGKRHSGMER